MNFSENGDEAWTYTYTAPVVGEMSLNPSKGEVYEYACHEGNYAIEDILGGARKIEDSQKK